MSGINPLNIIRLLSSFYEESLFEETVPSRVERQLAVKMKDVIDAAAVSACASVEEYAGLSYDDDFDGTELEIDLEKLFTDDTDANFGALNAASQGSAYEPTPPEARNFVDLEYKRRAVDFWNSAKTGKRTVASVAQKFKKVKNDRTLYRWECQLTNNGSRMDKSRALNDAVWKRFSVALENHAVVREIDLRRWALLENQEICLERFRASRNWAWSFQNQYRIKSRKVTKFVTSSYAASEATNKETATEFVQSVVPYVEMYGPGSLYNTDQSGFQLSMHSGRTLALQGAKKVLAAVQSVSATTHSYTIQPTIAADGKALPLLFLVLPETGGKFGPQIQREVDEMEKKYNNVYITASASRKLTKLHLLDWVRNVYGPFASDKSILLIDSWTTYNDEDAVHGALPAGKKTTLCRIPPGTTGIIQPEDVYFFRPWKEFDRAICDHVMLEGLAVTLHHRCERVKRQSLIWRQFCAPRYAPMIRYAFYACGYLKSERPEEFENPVQFCLHGLSTSGHLFCENGDCEDVSFLRCSYCEKMLCFDCFYVQYHNCTESSPTV